jgi:hypothetical protein
MFIKLFLLIIILTIIFIFNIINVPSNNFIISEQPLQENIEKLFFINENKEYKLLAKAKIYVKALVLSKKKYSDENSEIIPYDLALGWDKMSDTNYISGLKIHQSNRWYYYSFKNDRNISEIIQNSSNWHIIPANEEINNELKNISKYDLIHLDGYLVDISFKTHTIKTSMTRHDTGAGACEIMYVTNIKFIEN